MSSRQSRVERMERAAGIADGTQLPKQIFLTSPGSKILTCLCDFTTKDPALSWKGRYFRKEGEEIVEISKEEAQRERDREEAVRLRALEERENARMAAKRPGARR